MRLAVIALMLMGVASCGVDGPPERPVEQQFGVTIGGQARIGVAGRL
ncbi:hypothetical protein [Paracoccus sp. (in: a-proteobacteria)]|nr:hypothetical protein [Paracoccus sp. (in: a-proteobacteria)]MDO5647324.1 hypothetical protein [Paracoccus sp. (in: a-proteobacteria)]